MCELGEVPNEDQTACVGMFEKLTEICPMALLSYLSCMSKIILKTSLGEICLKRTKNFLDMLELLEKLPHFYQPIILAQVSLGEI